MADDQMRNLIVESSRDIESHPVYGVCGPRCGPATTVPGKIQRLDGPPEIFKIPPIAPQVDG
jgi:hypothetical protein